MEIDPPLYNTYKDLLESHHDRDTIPPADAAPPLELPVIDLSRLIINSDERESCKSEIARASEEWGFFQVVNHGISRKILDGMREEQVKVFKQPFDMKREEDKYLKFSPGTYRWGTPSATSLKQLAWSEAFHIPMSDISPPAVNGPFGNSLRWNVSVAQHTVII